MADLIQEKKRALGGWPMVIGWAAMILFALHASTHMVGAGDTWVALACGRHFINHGVDTIEPFSANSHKPGPTPEEVKTWPDWAQWITDKVGLDAVKYWHPTGWVNQNWLTHVIFYWLTHLSPFADAQEESFNTLVYWKFTIYILLVICSYYTGRILGVNPALSAVFACAAMFIGRSYLDIRPAGFSNLCVAALMLIFVLATYRNHLYIWLVVPLTVFWSNVHGGYIFVFIAITPIVVFRLLTTLSKRTTVGVFSILTWLALYLVMYKSTSHMPYETIPASEDKLLFLVVLLILGSIGLMAWRSASSPAFYGYHIFVTVVIFLVLFFARLSLTRNTMDMLAEIQMQYVTDNKISFVTAFAAALALGVILTLLKDRLTVASHRAIWHTAGAGAAAFVAAIVFNPFHLTNLTHTFVISVSEYAEGWRNVHEWWPAFRWDCPVGTSFPYLVMIIAGGGLLVIWLSSRLLIPKQLKAAKMELESQQRFFNIAIKILGYFASLVACWSLMVSFSLADVSLAGFLLVGLFVGILWASVFVNVNFIYAVIVLSLFALATGSKEQGYTGRYIFPFITIPCYFLLYAIGGMVSGKFSKTAEGRLRFSLKNIAFVVIASVVALLVSVIIENPFKFTGPVWAGRATFVLVFKRLYALVVQPGMLWGIQRMWGPPYEANLDELAGFYKHLFPAIYIINGACIVSWLLAPVLKEFIKTQDTRPQTQDMSNDARGVYQLPRIDLALITISAMTVYMAYRSRRFIPIAAYMSCPIIAMLVQQTLETVSSALNFRRRGVLSPGGVPLWLQRFLTVTGAVTVLGLATAWGVKFKEIYLDPSPAYEKLTSMFMRMTASAVKPFNACRFITGNNMSGNMFNYWTEGGFIAWAQPPDPNTGKTPLQLFMDGRAQAAYSYDSYWVWSKTMSGGRIVEEITRLARLRNQEVKFTPEDYVRIGEWVNSQMKQRNVWVVLMPTSQKSTVFVKGIEYNPDWRLVYLDDEQLIYVDITTERGREIYGGIGNGSTKFPDESKRNIMIAHNSLVYGRSQADLAGGLECVFRAYEEKPSGITIQLIDYFERYPELRPRIAEFLRRTLEDFMANEEKYLKRDGYHRRMMTVLIAIEYLRPEAAKENNMEQLKLYNDEAKKLSDIMNNVRYRGW
ncbi:MAG: hypothetical protein JW749_09005 [Sedimentisphaerales bacterium]|nr:hypothetical protein [Sedimentisphaerales bacterium]